MTNHTNCASRERFTKRNIAGVEQHNGISNRGGSEAPYKAAEAKPY
ncbi:MAG: hypothetical protein O3C29_12100 [Proteobacteria bacterium]|nr:hypothetical protein [Pseudomonadota bacterium]MDA1291114.1 hypothetical protein [Pseudomonadota bacterium]